MATELKTKVNDASVQAFLDTVEDEARRDDCYAVLKLMQEVTGCEPKMWGKSIVGFDTYHYKYASGQEGDWMATGFSPRKANLTLYIMTDLEKDKLVKDLGGKFKTGKSCLYLKRLDDVDQDVLRKLVKESVTKIKALYQSE